VTVAENRLLRAEVIINQGLGLLQRELLLPRLVVRKGVSDFRGAKDDTINIRIPSVLKGREYEWRTRTRAIVVDTLAEFSVPIRLDKHVYNAIGITDEEMTLDIRSWGEQVATPQIRAVAEMLESYIADAMENANYRHTVSYVPGDGGSDDRSFYRAAVAARRALNVEEYALNSSHLVKANEADSDEVLRNAVIGRIAGFQVIGNCNSVDPDFAVAMHPTAFALGNVAPEVPASVPGATATYESLAMRWIKDYDSDYLRERSVYSSFAGTASVEDGRDLRSEVGRGFGELTDENVRAVLIDFTPGS
jgi:hypothetical protein